MNKLLTLLDIHISINRQFYVLLWEVAPGIVVTLIIVQWLRYKYQLPKVYPKSTQLSVKSDMFIINLSGDKTDFLLFPFLNFNSRFEMSV